MVIDLPDHNIPQYIRNFIYWLRLPQDNIIVENLQRMLYSVPQRNQSVRISDIDIVTSPFFIGLDRETQERITLALSG